MSFLALYSNKNAMLSTHISQIDFYWQDASCGHCYYDNMVIGVKLIMLLMLGALSVSIILPDLFT